MARVLGSSTRPTAVALAREPLWTREYTLTLISLHLFFLGWSLLFATLPLYVGDAPKWQVGWVVGGAFGVASLIARPLSGRLTDRRGRRPVLLVGGGLTAAMLAAHALTRDPLTLTVVRLFTGAGMCLYTTAALAQLADVLPASRRGEGMGWYGVIYTLTNVYGPWLGTAVADVIGLRAFFLFPAAVTLGATVLAAPLKERTRPLGAHAGRLISRAALLPTVTFLALTMAFSVLTAFLALYVTRRELGSAGLFFFLEGLALVPARWMGGTLADRWGRSAIVLPGLALAAVGMLLLGLIPHPLAVYLAALIFGAGFGLGHTGLTILTVDRAAPEERGAAMATFALAWDAGTIGAFALGFVGDAVGFPALFVAAGLLSLVAAGGFVAAVRARAPRETGGAAARRSGT